MTFETISAVLLDFDGTLVDSTDAILSQYAVVADKLGLTPMPRDRFISVLGLPWRTALETLWPGVDVAAFTDSYSLAAEDLSPVAGAAEAVSSLAETYVVGMVTSRSERSLTPKLPVLGLDSSLFACIVTAETYPHHKPDPRVLKATCDDLGVTTSQTVYVGDSVIDAQCARDAGVSFIGVLTGGTAPAQFADHGVTDVIDSVAQVPTLLAGGRPD